MEKPKVLKELYIGIGLVALFFLILGIIVMRPFWIFAVGLLVGTLGACLWLYSMFDVLDRALDLGKKNAKNFVAVRSILRLLLVMGILGVSLFIHWNAFVGVAVGLLSLKISALVNPYVKRYITKTEDSYTSIDEIMNMGTDEDSSTNALEEARNDISEE